MKLDNLKLPLKLKETFSEIRSLTYFSEISNRQSTTPPCSSSSPSDSSDGSKGVHFPFSPNSFNQHQQQHQQQQHQQQQQQQQHQNMMISSLPFGAGHPGPSGSMQPPPHLLQSLEALHQHHLKLVSADQVSFWVADKNHFKFIGSILLDEMDVRFIRSSSRFYIKKEFF